MLVCSVSTLAFYIASTDSYGGIAIGPRWLIWLTPLWLLAMIPAAQRWAARGTLGKGAMLALGALSAWSSQRSPLDPWQHPWLYGLL